MKQSICVALVSVLLFNGFPVYAAKAPEEIRKDNIKVCVEKFLESAPEDFKTKNISLISKADSKQTGWLEEGVISAFLEKSISIIESQPDQQNAAKPDYAVQYNLIEEKKGRVKIGFKLIEAGSGKLVKYAAYTGSQDPENFNYERRVPKPAYKKPTGPMYGLYLLMGIVLVGYLLQPKI